VSAKFVVELNPEPGSFCIEPGSVMVKSMPTCFILKLGQGYASGPVNGDRHCFGDLPELDGCANASAEQNHCAGFIV